MTILVMSDFLGFPTLLLFRQTVYEGNVDQPASTKYDLSMRLAIVRRVLIFFVFIPHLSVNASAQGTILGVLEDNRGHYAGDPNFRTLRAVFKKSGLDWQPFPSDCPDQDCLKSTTSEYPSELTWTITFDGRNLGQVRTRTPKQYEWYSSVGQQEITSSSPVPTIGERSAEFGGQQDAPVYRPLVANSLPYFKDPDVWKPFSLGQDLVAIVQRQFRKQFPKLCRLGGPHGTEMMAFPYRDDEVKLVKGYRAKTGWTVVRLHLEAVDCQDVEAGFDIDDPWFVVDSRKSVKYLASGMWLVDAGDYDNDGKSELVFSIDRDNRGGYLLFYDDFKKRAAFEFSHH
jgi:hypothetical protein